MRQGGVRKNFGRVRTFAPILIVLGALALAPAVSAVTWNVNGASASCSDAGPGDATTPFCTIGKGAAVAVAGDTVLVVPATYREQVTAPASGLSGMPITYRASAPGVIVLGTLDVSDPVGWAPTATNAWSRPYAPSSSPSQVFRDGVRLAAAASATTTTTDSFYFDSVAKVLYVDIGGGNPGVGHVIEAGARQYGFKFDGRSQIVVDGFEIRAPNSVGVRMGTCSAITVRNCKVSYAGTFGMQALSCTTPVLIQGNDVSFSLSEGIRVDTASGATLQGNASHDNILHGIGLRRTTQSQVLGNTLYANKDPSMMRSNGLDVDVTSTDNLVKGNTAYGNDDSGIQVYAGSARNVLVRNVSRDNGDHGFDVNGSTDVKLISNTAYGNRSNGFNFENSAINGLLVDNITAANAVANLRVGTTAATGFVADRNLYSPAAGVPEVSFSAITYSTLASFQAAGFEAAGLEGDPGFRNPASGDLRLSLGSPAIDSADAGVSGFSSDDHDGVLPFDIPAVFNTGAGTPAYADRGAHEYTDARPVASLKVTPKSGKAPLRVTADGSASTDDHGVVTYRFSFGDGATVTQNTAIATHIYAAAGNFTVVLTVTDGAGFTASQSTKVTVKRK